jgi:hypothetical protein
VTFSMVLMTTAATIAMVGPSIEMNEETRHE